MQALFVSSRCGAVVQLDLMESVGGTDLNATARGLLGEICEDGGAADCCRVYLVVGGKLYLAGEEHA